MVRVAVAGVVLALVSAATAAAAVTVESSRCAGSFCNGVIEFRADPGENNVFSTAAASVPTRLIIRDAGAVIRGCPAVEGGVSCRNESGVVYVHLGDGDDQSIGGTQVWGGPGNDRISRTGTANGGPGNDVLTDVANILDDDDAGGNDVYAAADTPTDTVSADPRSILDYSKRKVGMRLDLRPGQPSEDQVSNNPKIYGTRAADVLTGDDAPNFIAGAGGRDVVRGMGGNDELSGDTVDGGAGDDTLAGGSLGGRIVCGPGTDVVFAEPRARIAADCEYLTMDGLGRMRLRLSMAGTRAGFVTGVRSCDCKGERWTITARGRAVATRRGGALRLNAAGRALLRRSGSLPLKIEYRYRNDYDQVQRTRFRLHVVLA